MVFSCKVPRYRGTFFIAHSHMYSLAYKALHSPKYAIEKVIPFQSVLKHRHPCLLESPICPADPIPVPPTYVSSRTL